MRANVFSALPFSIDILKNLTSFFYIVPTVLESFNPSWTLTTWMFSLQWKAPSLYSMSPVLASPRIHLLGLLGLKKNIPTQLTWPSLPRWLLAFWGGLLLCLNSFQILKTIPEVKPSSSITMAAPVWNCLCRWPQWLASTDCDFWQSLALHNRLILRGMTDMAVQLDHHISSILI